MTEHTGSGAGAGAPQPDEGNGTQHEQAGGAAGGAGADASAAQAPAGAAGAGGEGADADAAHAAAATAAGGAEAAQAGAEATDAGPDVSHAPTFAEMNLDADLRRAIDEMGFVDPTDVQATVYRRLLAGRDLLVQSRTGSGKTAAFAIPLAQRILDPSLREVQALCLCPTRELALQVADECSRIFQYSKLSVVAIYGGAPMGKQTDALAAGAQLVGGTPGRVLDHLRRGTLRLDALRVLVLDEADEMLSMGFYEEITEIIKRCPPERQTLLFSATIPEEIERIARKYMRTPEKVTLSADFIGVRSIAHAYYMVSGMGRSRDLLRVLDVEKPDSAIIFCNTREETSSVAEYLRRSGLDAEAISSDLTQKDRERVMGRMRAGDLHYLVATDIAARGIDISDLSHVINYTFPESAEVYVHRTGRTGRAGKSGIAISLISPRELGNFYYLKLTYKIKPEERTLPSEEELASRREGAHIERLRRELGAATPAAEWRSLARRLWAADGGEVMVAALLERTLAAAPVAGAAATGGGGTPVGAGGASSGGRASAGGGALSAPPSANADSGGVAAAEVEAAQGGATSSSVPGGMGAEGGSYRSSRDDSRAGGGARDRDRGRGGGRGGRGERGGRGGRGGDARGGRGGRDGRGRNAGPVDETALSSESAARGPSSQGATPPPSSEPARLAEALQVVHDVAPSAQPGDPTAPISTPVAAAQSSNTADAAPGTDGGAASTSASRSAPPARSGDEAPGGERSRRRRGGRGGAGRTERPPLRAGQAPAPHPDAPVIEPDSGQDFWEAWVDERSTPPASHADEANGAPGGASPEASSPGASVDDPRSSRGDGGRSRSRRHAPPLEPGAARLYLSLGRRDGAEEADIESLLAARGVSCRSYDLHTSHTYLIVDEAAVDDVVRALDALEHGGRTLVCERARR